MDYVIALKNNRLIRAYYLKYAKLQPYMYKPCVSKESKKGNCPGKES